MFVNEKEKGCGVWIRQRKWVYPYMDCDTSKLFFLNGSNYGFYFQFLICGNLDLLGDNYFFN